MGFVNLSNITSIEINVGVTVFIRLYTNTNDYYMISCQNGDTGENQQKSEVLFWSMISGVSSRLSSLPTSFSTLINYFGYVGNSPIKNSNGNVKTMYINLNGTYGDTFQPINNSYDLFGFGGSVNDNNSSGKRGFGCIWFVK